jgi:hypothetical protein
VPRQYTPTLSAEQLSDTLIVQDEDDIRIGTYFIPWVNFPAPDLSSRQRPGSTLNIQFSPGVFEKEFGNSFSLPVTTLEESDGIQLLLGVPKTGTSLTVTISGPKVSTFTKSIVIAQAQRR